MDGTIYVGSSTGILYAVNRDGAIKWSYDADPTYGHTCSSPAVGVDGTIYIGLGNSTLHAVNPDGTLKWS
jgi:outer membrane protein assembly factor BamB